MELINGHIKKEYGDKEFIVINTHNHWDHVWGNSIYSSNMIISHELCKKDMEQHGEKALEKYKDHRKGEVILTYPNVTFTDKICFEEDNILICHTPGHTEDSISILDLRDKILFAGDNLERPIPYVMEKDLEQYIKTLEEYLKLDVDVVIGGHTACENKELIHHNLDYARKELAGDKVEI